MSNHRTTHKSASASPGSLGTFAGVFTPSILTILGIILFLRLGYVVGNAGLGRALIIIALANTVSGLTTFSLSAIATNIKVKGGGDYYLISRTLGTEFGGSIGIVLFLAQSVSVGFYCIGFGEAMAEALPVSVDHAPRLIAGVAIAALFVFAWLGADWATRFQFAVMAVLVSALLSFFIGGFQRWETSALAQSWGVPSGGLPFWVLFAVFFPAVTGFTQGVSMSGDLKDAGKSLPLGTFLAVGISLIVYLAVAFVFAGTLPLPLLQEDYLAMGRVAAVGWLISAGVIAATLSSAMASFLGAPRILQSMAKDRIFPILRPFARGAGPADNPRRGVLLTTGIAFLTIALGNLNAVASVVSMFFLVSYGLLTHYEAGTESPSFRPRIRYYHRSLSLVGWVSCLGIMLAIDIKSGVLAVAVIFAVYQYLKRTAGPARWADSRRSYHLQHLRQHLLAAAAEPEHARDWRPQILAFSDDARRREWLLRFASWIEGGSGFTTAVRIVQGEGPAVLKLREEAEKELRTDITVLGLNTFPLVVVSPNPEKAVQILIQSFGIGPLQVNTLLLNWIEQREQGFFGLRELKMGRNLRTAFRLGCNIVMLDVKEQEWSALSAIPPGERRIDVWWWNDPSSSLMLLLAYLVTRSAAWEGAHIRVITSGGVVHPEKADEDLQTFLNEARISAETKIVSHVDQKILLDHSNDAALVFVPFRLKGNKIEDPLGEAINGLIEALPIVAMVLAAEDIDLDAEPEEGEAGERAAAEDAYADAVKRADQARRKAEEAQHNAEKAVDALNQAIENQVSEEDLKKAQEAAFAAEEEAKSASRKAAKEMAKAESAAQVLKELGVVVGDEERSEPDTTH